MSTPKRFYNGISSVTSDNPLGMLPYLDPTKYCVWMEDFILIPDTGENWTDTNTNGTLAVASTGGCGIATQTLGGADNDLSHVYPATATFALTSGKKAFFEAKIKVDKGAGGTIGQQELFIGLSTVATGTNFSAADGTSWAMDNAVGFASLDGSADIDAVVRVSDAESIDDGASTYADATWYVLSWYFDGTNVTFYVNDSQVAQLTTFPTGAMSPVLFVKAGEAKAAVLSTDYILVAVER
jgi:hypothetical protein